jgi:UDP-glucuronate 4-epimerase
MANDQDLAGLDPYELMEAESARLSGYFARAGATDWEKPTRCEGWTARDLLAHLAASEDYNRACLDGTVQEFLTDVGAKGAVDLASANEIGLRGFDRQSVDEIVTTWRTRSTENREMFRARDGGDVDSSVGAYPARRQAFHLAFELATHADDFGIPVSESEAAARLAWQASFARFAIKELKPDLSIESSAGRTRVKGEGLDIELPDDQFVDAVAARLPAGSDIDDAATLNDARVLVTGATGQVALPVALGLAAGNEVIALARFKDAAARERLESAGVRCIATDFARGSFDGVPTDVDYVCNFAVVKSNKWEVDLAGNAEAAGLLMAHCRSARAFLHCSSTGVYEAADGSPQLESDPLGDNHRVMMPTYSISKIAAEAVVRTTCRLLDVPTTIARLNVPYGDGGGWPAFHLALMRAGSPVPVHPDGPSRFNPIHDDDILATLPGMLAAATVPATIVNWGGDDETSIEAWCEYMAEVAGIEARFEPTTNTIGGIPTDNTRRRALVGPTSVRWKDGFRRMVEAQTQGAASPGA